MRKKFNKKIKIIFHDIFIHQPHQKKPDMQHTSGFLILRCFSVSPLHHPGIFHKFLQSFIRQRVVGEFADDGVGDRGDVGSQTLENLQFLRGFSPHLSGHQRRKNIQHIRRG